MQTYTLFELNEFLRRVLALNVPDAVWVQCEIATSRLSRGHYFLELLEKETSEGDIIAQASAVLWQSTWRKLRRTVGRELDTVLQDGMEVKLKMQVELHERYGLKMIIEDIDPSYTLGKLELQRQQTLQELQRLQLLQKNGNLPLPLVIQRLAVFTSEQAAGWQDFQEQLQHNSFGYNYHLRLFNSAVQGLSVRGEMLQQFKKINRQYQEFDAVVIVRGGGARLDLAAFDDLELCKAIANCPIPVLTGIGHDVDESVADKVAHTALKTPTAVADFLIQRSLSFENQLFEQAQQLQSLTNQIIRLAYLQLDRLHQSVQFESTSLLREQQVHLKQLKKELPQLIHSHLRAAAQELEQLTRLNNLLSVEATLSRGYSLTTQNGKIVRSSTAVEAGDTVDIRWKDGSHSTTIQEAISNSKS